MGVSACPRPSSGDDGGIDAGTPRLDAGSPAEDAGSPDGAIPSDAGPSVDAGCIANVTVIPSPYETNAVAISDDGELLLLNVAKGVQGWQAALYSTEVVELAPGRYRELEATDLDEYGVVGRVFDSPEINPAQPFLIPLDGGPLRLINDAGGEALATNAGNVVGEQFNGAGFWMTPDGSIRRSQSAGHLKAVKPPRAGGYRPIPRLTGLVVDEALQPEFEVSESPSAISRLGSAWAVGGSAGRPTRWNLIDGGAQTLEMGAFAIGNAFAANESASIIGGVVVPVTQVDIDDTLAAVWRNGELLWTSTHTAELRIVRIVDSSLDGKIFAAQCRWNGLRKACKLSLTCP